MTVAWYTTFDVRHFPSRGGINIIFRQFHSLSAACVEFFDWLQSDGSFLLCGEMIVFMFGMRDIKARDTKLNYQSTYLHSKTTTNLST